MVWLLAQVEGDNEGALLSRWTEWREKSREATTSRDAGGSLFDLGL